MSENAKQPDVSDIRWAINVLLEKIAGKFEAWETFDLFRSEAANTVRSFKHDIAPSTITSTVQQPVENKVWPTGTGNTPQDVQLALVTRPDGDGK